METFIVRGEPAPWTAQMRAAKRSDAFVRMQVYQACIQAQVKQQWGSRDRITGPVYLEMEFYRGMPSPVRLGSQTRFEWQVRHIQQKPDWLNYFKAAEDALQGILFENDSQVVSGKGLKWYTGDSEGYTIIRIRPLTEVEQIYKTRMGWGATQIRAA
ncbi:MAG: RusA family crossover junction endodeoxyribonuclease [Candidatus Binatia bacterium]